MAAAELRIHVDGLPDLEARLRYEMVAALRRQAMREAPDVARALRDVAAAFLPLSGPIGVDAAAPGDDPGLDTTA